MVARGLKLTHKALAVDKVLGTTHRYNIYMT